MKDGDPTHRLDVRVERWTQDELNEPGLEHPKVSRTEHYRGTMDDCDLAALAIGRTGTASTPAFMWKGME